MIAAPPARPKSWHYPATFNTHSVTNISFWHHDINCHETADYYPLIIAALPDSSAEARIVVYEQARTALLAQLRAASPPFTGAELMLERLALEEAVRMVEGEVAQRARDVHLPSFNDLATDADDIGEVPSMIITGAATGRLKGVWRCSMRHH